MTQEEKQLLLQDLSARLLYGVKIKCGNCPINLSVTGIIGEYIHHIPYYVGGNIEINTTKIDDVKPYLRTMSSMTAEELSFYNNHLITPGITILEENLSEYLDWMHSHYFDYRGLIEKGLALEAPEGMYGKTTCGNCPDKDFCSQSEYIMANCLKLK